MTDSAFRNAHDMVFHVLDNNLNSLDRNLHKIFSVHCFQVNPETDRTTVIARLVSRFVCLVIKTVFNLNFSSVLH